MKQGSRVRLKADIQFPNPLTGRHNTWRAGAGYWIATPEHRQTEYIEVCKIGRPMGSGMRFAPCIIAEHFEQLG